MTLLMTSGEFDLSVGSVFGLSPVVMWALYNSHTTSLEIAFLIALVLAALIGLHHAGSAARVRKRRAVAGSAGDELCRPVIGQHGLQQHPTRL